jgi:hypothetical protein
MNIKEILCVDEGHRLQVYAFLECASIISASTADMKESQYLPISYLLSISLIILSLCNSTRARSRTLHEERRSGDWGS